MVNILYIDDDKAEHKFFAYFLKLSPDQHASLRCVDELEDALACLAEGNIDFVFLDDRFSPYISSLETLPKILPLLGEAKIAVVSSSIEASHLKSAAMLGVDKIFDKVRLKNLLKQGVGNVFKDQEALEGQASLSYPQSA